MNDNSLTGTTGKWADLALRSFSAIILMPVALYCIWQGGIWFQVFIAVLAVLIAHEWADIVHAGNERAFAVLAMTGISSVFVTESQGLDAASAVILMLWLISVLQWALRAGQGTIWGLLGVFYTGLPIVAFVLLREDGPWGRLAVIWCFVIVWATDISAYFVGRLVGGPKLAPRLSPKKTWAGLLGGMAGAAVASAIFAHFAGLNVGVLALLAAGLACVEQAGDILESAMKRRFGRKDSGNFIPGHGGVLDRVDGLLALVLASAVIGFVHHAGSAASGLLVW